MDTVGFRLDGDGVVLVEVNDDEAQGLQPAGVRDWMAEAAEITFDQAVGMIRPVAQTIRKQIDEMPDRPDEVEVSFGVKLTGSTSIKIVSGGGEAHLTVTMKWDDAAK